jgi:glycosyltransferase involved in cell wall biosynthesis
MKAQTPALAPQSAVRSPQYTISVVIASLNEADNLVATVASVKHDCPEAEIIVVDDASPKPEPIAMIRNPKRLGGPRSRRLGGLRATGDVVIFLDAHNALDWETACWFARRYPEIGPIKPEFKAMLDRPHKLRTLAAAAMEREAIVYGGCMFSTGRAGACLVHENGMLGGRWMKRRPDLPPLELWPTSLLMGAFYAIPRTVLMEKFGGWPALPNYHGAQELAVALLAAAHQVPILFHDGVALWHLFRGYKPGYVKPTFDMNMENGAWLGYAAAWRLVLDDAHWKDYRSRMRDGQGPHGEIPEHVLAQVETDEFGRYRADVQSRFKLNSDELLAEIERRIAADRDTRIQGAEDKAINQGKKILLAITFCADDGTSSNAARIGEKRQILGRCLESARASGADDIALFVVAPSGANPYALTGTLQASIRVIPVGDNPGLPLGETRAVRAAIAQAAANGYEWVVKICGDVFHPRPNWAKEMVQRGIAAPNGAALVAGICNNKCAVTKVFAARSDFLARTWPEDSEVLPFGAGAVLERIWTAKIERLGLANLWLPVECCQVFEGKANWWTPVDPAFEYKHTHVVAVAVNWKMEKS